MPRARYDERRMTELLNTRRVFIAVLFLGILGMAARNVVDPDIWWHLKTGEWIMQHRAVPHTDPFSYTRAGQPLIAHEWLSDLVIYCIYRSTGAGGFSLAFALIHFAPFFLLSLPCDPNPFAPPTFTPPSPFPPPPSP